MNDRKIVESHKRSEEEFKDFIKKLELQALETAEERLPLYLEIGLKDAKMVLDVGCGSGVVTRDIARFTKGRVFGVDGSVDLINVAEEILVDHNKITEKQLDEALDKQEKVGEILIKDGIIEKTDVREAMDVQNQQMLKSAQMEKHARETTKTIRIDQHKLDDFANAVGELFINIDAFNFLKNQLESKNIDFEISARFASTISSMDIPPCWKLYLK